MQSLSIIGHIGWHNAAAQQLLPDGLFQVKRCAELENEQVLQSSLQDSDHTLLIYCPPGLALAQALAQNSDAACDLTLQNWGDQARALLQHYMLNRDHCTLVSELALRQTPDKVLGSLASKTGLAVNTDVTQNNEQLPQPILEALGTSLAYADQHSYSLYRDLETVADINSETAMRQHLSSLRLELQKIASEFTKLSSAAQQHKEGIQKQQELQDENQLLTVQLHQVQEELEKYFSENQKLSEAAKTPPQAAEPAEGPPRPNDPKLQGLQEENELLLLQLHQVQEELEHYFCEYQKLSEGGYTAPHRTPQLTDALQEALFDLRSESIIGDNWHEAEHDGRWAGPGTESTLTLPAVGKGRFKLQFDIVHALDVRIAKDMQVLLNEVPLTLTHTFGKLPLKPFPCRVSTEFDTRGIEPGPWQLRLRFAKTASPSEKGGDDTRQLTIRLKGIRVIALAAPNQD
ncbi:hypothetical protein [Gilvimarinus sp. 1_MG-2023]|uniref:hypothetical protein n=1 Tax=Gilvimarinus sp. 1_MG-2023 TaxID=3062638 RepID=UPI0026E376C8|nr:hypothetical protein [Gilvimarinus sp. 1_MG-2023]MDO6746287.1 hypothetical protein [Gilvimarinus sp. 1_MG-2023]